MAGWEVKAFFGIIGILAGGSMGMNCLGEEINTSFTTVLKNDKILKDKYYKKGTGSV